MLKCGSAQHVQSEPQRVPIFRVRRWANGFFQTLIISQGPLKRFAGRLKINIIVAVTVWTESGENLKRGRATPRAPLETGKEANGGKRTGRNSGFPPMARKEAGGVEPKPELFILSGFRVFTFQTPTTQQRWRRLRHTRVGREFY